MKIFAREKPAIPGCLQNFFFVFAAGLFAILAIILSTNYQYPENSACQGMLGAGFPVLYICDNWGGGSPTDSWGKITPVDVLNGGINFGGFMLDFLFYAALFLIGALVIRAIYHRLITARYD